MLETDALGIAAMAHYFQSTGAPVAIQLQSDSDSDDGEVDYELMSLYFQHWTGVESEVQHVLQCVTRTLPAPARVLDIGCLAGRFLLYFQEHGYDVVGIDTSPGAVWVAQQRGAYDTRQQDGQTITPESLGGTFDATLLLGHNIGLGGTTVGVQRLLQAASDVTRPDGMLLVNSIDKEQIAEDWARAQVRYSAACGRHVGHTRYRIRFGPYCGPWFDWIHVSPPDIVAWAAPFGWKLDVIYTREDNPGYWAGVLRKVMASSSL